MVYSDVNDALAALDRKIGMLNNLVSANEFLVACMLEENEFLQVMAGDEAREMLRLRARQKFHQDFGETPNPEVLSILEKTLGHAQTAEVIPFPGKAARRG